MRTMFKPLYDKVMMWNSQDLIGALNSLFPSQFKKKGSVCRKAAMKIPLVKKLPGLEARTFRVRGCRSNRFAILVVHKFRGGSKQQQQ